MTLTLSLKKNVMCTYQWVWREAWGEQEEKLTLSSVKAFPAVLTLDTSPVTQQSEKSSSIVQSALDSFGI